MCFVCKKEFCIWFLTPNYDLLSQNGQNLLIKETDFTHRIHKDLRRTVDLCQKAEAAGVSWITVHGRTSEERHQPVHYDAIKTIKDSVSVPVIANGDIKYLRDVESTYQRTGVNGMFVFKLNPLLNTLTYQLLIEA